MMAPTWKRIQSSEERTGLGGGDPVEDEGGDRVERVDPVDDEEATEGVEIDVEATVATLWIRGKEFFGSLIN